MKLDIIKDCIRVCILRYLCVSFRICGKKKYVFFFIDKYVSYNYGL